MTFELEVKYARRVIYIEGEAIVDMRCECCDQPHVQRVDYDQITDVATGLDVQRDDVVMTYIEDQVDQHIYNEIEAMGEEGVA